MLVENQLRVAVDDVSQEIFSKICKKQTRKNNQNVSVTVYQTIDWLYEGMLGIFKYRKITSLKEIRFVNVHDNQNWH